MAGMVAIDVLDVLQAAYTVLDGNSSSNASEIDPYLQALPAFTYAMPVQVIVLGVTITLLCVLLVHLLFTIRYHVPLSKLNYCFQCIAVLLNLGRTSGEIRLLMEQLSERPKVWPYMFDYIEVAVPPTSWNLVQLGLWQTLLAISALAVHCTHIQFLTLLFPSGLEARLILSLLGPLALLSSFLYYTQLSSIPAIDDLGDAIRNTANSTLTLLYTLALLIWGLTLNRSRAWRTDGGTAAFGIFALVLGISGTGINFVEVKEDRMRWLPSVVECVLLWQSWVGFWWWVGSGMWNGEAEAVEKREARKKKRGLAKRAKQALREARALATGSTSATETSSMRRRRPVVVMEEEVIEMVPMGDGSQRATRVGEDGLPSESVSSGSTPPPVPSFLDPIYALFRPFLARLKIEHDEAAVKKAAEPRRVTEGWGIRALGRRGRRERGERRAEMGRALEAGDMRAGFEADGGQELEEWEDEELTELEREMRAQDEAPRRERSRSPPPPRQSQARPPQGTGRSRPAEGNRWTHRGVVARLRVRERDTFD